MSGEFREVSGYFLHSVLDDVSDPGEQPLSQLLFDLYVALRPLERACAWVEAADSTPDSLFVASFENAPEAIRACGKLITHLEGVRDAGQRLLRKHAEDQKNERERD
jgi:hypothetical protein